jgi:Thiol-activated cytolysin
MNTSKNTLSSLNQKLLVSACMASLLLNLVACNGGEGGGSEPTADFNGEVYSHKGWSELSPLPQSSKSLVDTSLTTEEVDTDRYSCTNDSYSMTDTPKKFVAIEPDASIMWLGNLIQGSSHLQVGELVELPVSERAPLNISIDLLTGDNFRRVEHPSLSSVNSAIGEMINNAVTEGLEASSTVYFESKEAHSSRQTSLDLGFTAEYLGGSAEASLSVDTQGEEKSFFAYFIQKAFTVSMELPTSPGDMVSDAFTQSQLDDLKARGKIGDANPPLYISNMSYGRVLIYKMTSTHSKSRIQAAINASYHGITGGGSGYTEIELQQTLSSASIQISAFGGNQASIEALIRSGQLRDYFSGDTKLTSMQPISFEIRNLQDNSIADISRTTEYNVKQCSFLEKTIPAIGERIKITLDKVKIAYDCDAGATKGSMFGRFDIISYDPANKAKITRRIRTIKRDEAINIQSGNYLSLNNSYSINKYYGKPFEISAQLMDRDSGARGADDLVGNWNANQFSIANKSPQSYSKKAVSNCSDKNPTLYYKIERVGYLY